MFVLKNPLVVKWEKKLQDVFDRIDERLEETYGDKFPLRPNRPKAGQGVGADADGLFDLGISFSAGFGSSLGPGYVFTVRIATLQKVPKQFKSKVETEVLNMLKEELPKNFPNRNLKVDRDGNLFKVYGDLDLN